MALVPADHLNEADIDLLRAALRASGSAYAPYSGFAVGAAVRGVSGTIHLGANVENASYGVAICAEVAAISAAMTAGETGILSIGIVGHRFVPPAAAGQVVTPCGRCRQVISEIAQMAGIDVRVVSGSGDLRRWQVRTISTLLPDAFGQASLAASSSWPALRQHLMERVSALSAARPAIPGASAHDRQTGE